MNIGQIAKIYALHQKSKNGNIRDIKEVLTVFGLTTLTAVSLEVFIDSFLTGAITGLTLVTTGSKVKKHYKSSKKEKPTMIGEGELL